MIKLKNYRFLYIVLALSMLTSSCEDKKQDNFGAVSINFDYQKEVISPEDESSISPSIKNSETLPIKTEVLSQNNIINKPGRPSMKLSNSLQWCIPRN